MDTINTDNVTAHERRANLLLITLDEIEAMPVSTDWRQSSTHVCKDCGQLASIHPLTSEIWGCVKCGYSTYAVGFFFRLKETD